MPIVRLADLPKEPFPNGATYQTLVGDDAGTTPIRVGVQISPPGYSTGVHSHPYMEVVSVIEGEGEAWIDGEPGVAAIGPGTTMIFPPDVRHSFSVTGGRPMKTIGIHASPNRVVERPPGETRPA